MSNNPPNPLAPAPTQPTSARQTLPTLIYETNYNGHRSTYVRVLAEALLELGVPLSITAPPNADDDDNFVKQLGPLRDRFQRITVPEINIQGRSIYRLGRDRAQALLQVVYEHQPRHLYLPTVDGLSEWLGLSGKLRRWLAQHDAQAEACLHRVKLAYEAGNTRERFRRRLGLWAHPRAGWSTLHLVDLLAYNYLQQNAPKLQGHLALLPDPVETPPPVDAHTARQRLQLPAPPHPHDTVWLGCSGEMSNRKGIDLLLDHFLQAAPPHARLLLAGRCRPEITERLTQDPEAAKALAEHRIVQLDRFLTAEELHLAMCAMDLVALPYRQPPAISSILLRAVAAHRPVLATDYGWLGLMVQRFNLGHTADPENLHAWQDAQAEALAHARDYQPDPATAQLRAFHQPQNFAAVFTARLRQRLGLPPQPTLTWEQIDPAPPPPHPSNPSPATTPDPSDVRA